MGGVCLEGSGGEGSVAPGRIHVLLPPTCPSLRPVHIAPSVCLNPIYVRPCLCACVAQRRPSATYSPACMPNPRTTHMCTLPLCVLVWQGGDPQLWAEVLEHFVRQPGEENLQAVRQGGRVLEEGRRGGSLGRRTCRR